MPTQTLQHTRQTADKVQVADWMRTVLAPASEVVKALRHVCLGLDPLPALQARATAVTTEATTPTPGQPLSTAEAIAAAAARRWRQSPRRSRSL